MLEGKLKQALKLIDTNNGVIGVHDLTDNVKRELNAKHPESEPGGPPLENGPSVQEVIFEEITSETIIDSARKTSGSGGPTKIGADIWRRILCSKFFSKISVEVADELAKLSRKMCVCNINFDSISTLVACRLVPLMKEDNGVRPVGVGEVVRRIIGGSVTRTLSEDIQNACGLIQTCSGLQSGIDSAVHAMKKVFSHEWCEAVLLVDAENAFNRLNRKEALKNIQISCPPMFKYLHNTYQESTKMYLSDGSFIWSKEGTTQGDNAAMAMYGLGVKPLIDELSTVCSPNEMCQVWYADDSSGGGKLLKIKQWLDIIKEKGPKHGYFAKLSKTILILKSEEYLEQANELFKDYGITITLEGNRHIGAAIGSDAFKQRFIGSKVEKWCTDVEKLATFAEDEPQAALSAFTSGVCSRWLFTQRTIENSAQFFAPLENTIREKLIPAIIGKQVSDFERKLLSLPLRYGGIGLLNPVETAEHEYIASTTITESMTEQIFNQDMDISKIDKGQMRQLKNAMKTQKENKLQSKMTDLKIEMNERDRRYFEGAQEKGASAWLSCLPIKDIGYSLNKREFRDAISLRYGWKISDTPKHCACGKPNCIEHTLTCPKGGYVNMRHNAVRNTEASLMKEVCKDVQIEPMLLPVGDTQLNSGSSTENQARLDIAARGVWSPNERTFFDVRITHPTSPSYMNKSTERLLKINEQEKIRKYNDRVLQVEKASFVPLVYTTNGGMSKQCERLHKQLAQLICEKRGEKYATVMTHIRTRLRFALLKSILAAIRGYRGKCSKSDELTPISEIDFSTAAFDNQENDRW